MNIPGLGVAELPEFQRSLSDRVPGVVAEDER